MSRPSSEALFCSSLINNHDTGLGALYGVEPSMMVGFESEFRWMCSFQDTYGYAPSRDALLAKFSDFPFCDATDSAFAADEVRQAASQRALRHAVRQAAFAISEGDYTDAAMSLASYAPLSAVKPPQNALYDLSFINDYTERLDVLEVPWRTLQAVTGGIRPGDLWYQAARLGQGKSWLALELAASALQAGRAVNIFSLEMPRAQLLTRLHVVLGRRLGVPVDHKKMRDKIYDLLEYKKLVGRIRDEVTGQVYIYDSSDGPVSPATVAARADVDLTIIDYAGLMASPTGGRAIDDWRTMAAISNGLKQVAIAKNTRILALAQINRAGDENSKYPPKVKHLAQSDSLGQDGDVILTHKAYSPSCQIFSIEKNRHGEGSLNFYTRFSPNDGLFGEVSRDHADDLRDREAD